MKVNMGSVKSAKQILKTDIDGFNQSSSSADLSASCGDAEVSQLLEKSAKDIKQSLKDLLSKLDRYAEIIDLALGYIQEADESFPETEFDIKIPSGLAGLASFVGLSIPWYTSIEDLKLGRIYKGLENSLLGMMPNFVTSGNPQGLTEFDHYLVGTNSAGTMYIYDKDTGKTKSIALGSEYHLGGLSYHNGSLYVATNDTISKFNFDDLLTKDIKDITPETYKSRTTENNNVSQVSFLTTTGDGRLITGQFHHTGSEQYKKRGGAGSDLLVYNIQGNGLSEPTTLTIPDNMTRIQGACVYQKDGKDYYLLTSSYGKSDDAKSQLYVATVGPDGHTLVKQNQITLPSGAEQVTVTTDGNIAVMYEGNTSSRNITVLDPNTVIL